METGVMREVKVAVIGAGTAGLTAYRAARRHTDSVLLIDPGPLGTTCARVGCMPSKLLIAAAETAWHMRHGATFGVHPGSIDIDGPAVMERVRSLRDRFVGKVMKGMESISEADRLNEAVRFVDDHTLQTASGERIRAERIIIATGSRSAVPGFLREAGSALLLNDDLFELPTLPESVVVFGPGVIGLELGQALSRLGVRVRMFGIGGFIGPLDDADMRQKAYQCFNAELPLDPDAKVELVKKTEAGVEVSFRNADGELLNESFQYLLAATGRRPNVDQLGLENTSLQLDEHGIPCYDRTTMQCSLAHIFIAGDANNELPLLHEAADEGLIAGLNAGSFPELHSGNRTTPLAVVFSDPQIATVGLRPSQIESQYAGRYLVASFDFADLARAKVLNRAVGLMKIWVEKENGRLLGVEILGPDAEHLGHLLAWSMEQQLTVADLLKMPYYHPVIEEGLRALLRELRVLLAQDNA